MSKNWFEVDTKGLKALQDGKPKTFIVRELLQNAFDEDITMCKLEVWRRPYGEVVISVEDDSKEGFRDLSDAFTLFKDTYKRSDATKRGRFNLGEKQAFSICQRAEIITTTGTLVFDDNGRHQSRKKRDKGSVISVTLKMKREEVDEIRDFVEKLLIPEHINFEFNYKDENGGSGVMVHRYIKPYESFEATLRTELKDGESFRPTRRKTKVHVHRHFGDLASEERHLYELGIPVCEIDCDFSIDVQQKVPLSTDRDTVSASFLKELYALVLNHTYEVITPENAANAWVREAVSSSLIEKEAVQSVVHGRFGSKVVVANPSDPIANDDALASGYHVVRGSELNGDEWENIRRFSAISSSTQMFGKILVDYVVLEPNEEQQKVAAWAKKFFKEFFRGPSLKVEFISSPKANTIADFQAGGHRMRFNVPKIHSWMEGSRPSKQMIDLILHEFGHLKGRHTERAYHDTLTAMGAWLTIKALDEPEWFEL